MIEEWRISRREEMLDESWTAVSWQLARRQLLSSLFFPSAPTLWLPLPPIRSRHDSRSLSLEWASRSRCESSGGGAWLYLPFAPLTFTPLFETFPSQNFSPLCRYSSSIEPSEGVVPFLSLIVLFTLFNSHFIRYCSEGHFLVAGSEKQKKRLLLSSGSFVNVSVPPLTHFLSSWLPSLSFPSSLPFSLPFSFTHSLPSLILLVQQQLVHAPTVPILVS